MGGGAVNLLRTEGFRAENLDMSRNIIQVARMRMQDVLPGDVVNRDPESTGGWFLVGIIETLFDGKTQFSSSDRRLTLSGEPTDICGVQVLKPMDIPVPEAPALLTETEAAAAAQANGH